MNQVMEKDGVFIEELRKVGIRAKRWRNRGTYAPPADVNYKGELRVHTGGKPELIATDNHFRQAVIRLTDGRYKYESFLVGMDETSNFVCRLPTGARTVEEAHEILRPMGALPHTIRQGEWFFIPVENGKCKCGSSLDDQEWDGVHEQRGATMLGGTTHRAERVARHGSQRTYVKGKVADTRSGRHAPVDLGERWHEAVHNTEKALDQEPQRTTVRRFD